MAWSAHKDKEQVKEFVDEPKEIELKVRHRSSSIF